MSVPLPPDLREQVSRALTEDVGPGDLTAGLIGESAQGTARIVNREAAVLAGTAWVDEVFRQVDDRIATEWLFDDGARLEPDTEICRLHGPARGLLTGERTALNFLQTLSATATEASRYAEAVVGTDTVILDTRKTLPGLRTAQKYAVLCGGCRNHRAGLYDGILIKENHIMAAGSIGAAVGAARGSAGDRPVEVEVESLEEAGEALTAGADILLLDNFSLDDMREAVRRTAGRVKLEASGGVGLEGLRAIAETGVDFISVGAMTKNVRALDLSMRFHFDD